MEGIALPYTEVDTRSAKYRDRLYRVWAAFRDGKPRVFFTHSTDRGASWSTPRTLPAEPPASSRQYQPTLAVNHEGTLGVTWFDTRDSTDGSQYHLYFAASLDGGTTFLPPVRVSSAPSTPGGRGNSVPAGMTWPQGADTVVLSFLSAASRWSTGGDYLGMTANRAGIFYPLWTDARSGTYQLYTAAIRVEPPPPPPPSDPEEAKRDAALARPEDPRGKPELRVRTSLTGKVEFVFDPTIYDAAENTVELPLRLRNTSNFPIYPPIELEIVALGSGWEDQPPKRPPQVLNADNGESGVGARFALDAALGGDAVLAPGMVSGPVPLRFRVVFEPLDHRRCSSRSLARWTAPRPRSRRRRHNEEPMLYARRHVLLTAILLATAAPAAAGEPATALPLEVAYSRRDVPRNQRRCSVRTDGSSPTRSSPIG